MSTFETSSKVVRSKFHLYYGAFMRVRPSVDVFVSENKLNLNVTCTVSNVFTLFPAECQELRHEHLTFYSSEM